MVTNGRYINWGERNDIIGYMSCSALAKAMLQLGIAPFSDRAARETFRKAISDIPRKVIVNETTRFPDDGAYINLHESGLGQTLRTIIDASLFEEYEMHCKHGIHGYANNPYEDAMLAYTEGIDCIKRSLNMLGSPLTDALKGIYTRQSYEEKHQLTWADK
ncbi:hypothetical protein GQX74_012244 [Glossina fuscipes]|nr:hypothetical protein GQX74_012244 [Glossina fuscipes]